MERLEAICREMCKADNDNPDRVAWIIGDPDAARRIALGDIVIDSATGPMWLNYERMARRFIAAHRAMAWVE